MEQQPASKQAIASQSVEMKQQAMMKQQALRMLETYFGYTSFRPAQEAPIASLLRNEDVIGIMPTGAGKSICFQIPALCKAGLTIVFSPLISLMKDQVDGLLVQNIPAALINSTLTQAEFNKTMYEVRSGKIKLLYIAPERLGSNFFCNVLRALPIAQVIVDEAHCISEWGHDFRPSYRLIGEWLNSLPKRPIVGAFTATATKYVENDIKKLLGLDNANVYVTGFDRPNLSFSVIRTPKRMDYVVHYVRQHANENGIIYCATRKDVDRVYENLTRAGIKVGHYHGGLSDEVRREMQNAYADDKLQVMVATNAFGMGIDKSNVRYVLHYQMPRNMESYYQEAGRAGRDGAPAECILLYSGQDVQVHKYLIEQSIETPERQEVELRKLQSMIDYCFCSNCLRKYMLNYFGESTVWTTCDNCSSCKGSGDKVNVTKEAKAIFRAIMGTDERYGASMITSIVRGDRTDRIMRAGHDALPVFGLLSNVDEKSIKGLIQQFVASGYLRSSSGKYPVLSLTAGAEEVLAGHKEVEEIRQHVSVPSRTSRSTSTTSRGKASSGAGGLFEHLRQHRKRLAEEAGLRPYLIFPDTVLIDLANLRPTTLGEFGNVKGVGEAKLKKYGLSFLQAIAEYKR
ncbi:MAG: DNA helicase RecQ [Veillonella dispar]|uniref:DNA helicase RecQ n=1 Tax=Veillonella TaxID=29465 RepID=UPI000E5D4B3D|nr:MULTISPECIES: DNA helicase RecQ [Veillonella]MBS5710051.1 DNA helicase RecQ [Veillonella sp.]MBS6383231.1 DNA helicase RecQ [Veillonella dispar]MDU2570112.1 DNA helicase RecQ [Veillonella sp.]MDU4877241.1 DNA helicase RecQ [Veillonella dispar]MDU4886709.1 DNA helicase RecQ [Veillonella dispar]